MVVPKLCNESIIHMVRRPRLSDESAFGRLVQEIRTRFRRTVRGPLRKLPNAALEDIVPNIELEILKLILAPDLIPAADFFEVSFTTGVEARACDAKRRYKASVMGGRRGWLPARPRDEDGDEIDPFKLIQDPGASPEEAVIASNDQALCRNAIDKVRGQVDPQYVEAALLFHCEDVPMSSKDPKKDSIARRQGITEPAVRYRIDTVMKALRNILLGEGYEN